MTAAPSRILRPSSAPRWGSCSGSFALEAQYPEEDDSPEAREGTAAHHYVTEHLQGRSVAVGDLAPNGHPIDKDMLAHGLHYIADVTSELTRLYVRDPQTQFRVETKVFPHQSVHPDNEGTPDTWALSVAARELILWDYKYGHLGVEVFGNFQLVNYVAGIFEGNGLTREDTKDWRISLRVIQPRAYHRDGIIRTWGATGSIVWAHIDALAHSAIAAKRPGATARSGPWCRDCKARVDCETNIRAGANSIDVAGQATRAGLSVAAMATELDHIRIAEERLKARKVGLEQALIATIRAGRPVPRWQMGFVDSQERWSVPTAAVVAVGDAFGVDLRLDEPVKVGAARAKFKAAGIPVEVLGDLVFKPSGAAKLIPVDPNAAQKAFGNPSNLTRTT